MEIRNELRTTSKYPFPTAPREAGGKSGLVRCFIVAKSNLEMFVSGGFSKFLGIIAYITIDSMHNVVRRKVGHLRVYFCEQIGECLDESFPFFLRSAIHRLYREFLRYVYRV